MSHNYSLNDLLMIKLDDPRHAVNRRICKQNTAIQEVTGTICEEGELCMWGLYAVQSMETEEQRHLHNVTSS
jgi:hypothetical protein